MSEYTLLSSISKPADLSKRIYRVLRPTLGGCGMFSYVWTCLQSIYNYPNDKYYFDMRNFSPYYDPTITHTNNVWEYYFKQPHIDKYPDEDDIIDIGLWNGPPAYFCNLSGVSPENRLIFHNIIEKNVILLPHMREKIDTFVKKHDMSNKKILGVHCRSKHASFDSAYYNSPERYIKEIADVEKDYEMIFVISDDFLYIEDIKKAFGDKVLFDDDIERQTINNEEDQITNVAHGYKLRNQYNAGRGVITDAYLLGYSTFLICPYSNVSTFAHYLNLNMKYVDIDLKYGNTRLP